MARNNRKSGRENFGAELDRVLKSVGDSGSVGYQEIQRNTGLDGAVLNEALDRLEHMGLIMSRNVRGLVHYWKSRQTTSQIWYTVDEAAQYLRVSRRTIYKLVKEMQLAPYKVGPAGHRRFKQEDVDAVMRKEQVAPDSALMASDDPVLAELWNNDNDAEYDRL